MRKFLTLLSVMICLAVAKHADGQPRPSDATPNDYVPPTVQELPAPEVLPRASRYLPNYAALPPAAEDAAEMPPEISPHAEKWRYVSFGGSWWYRQPNNRWSYWSEGRWVDYLPPGRGNSPPGLQPPPPAPRRLRLGTRYPYYRYPYGPGPAYPYGGTY